MEKNAFSLDAEVVANEAVGTRYRRVILAAPEMASRVQPGQFVNLRVTRGLEPLLARPFSVFWADPESGQVELLFKEVGRGTRMLAAVDAGRRLGLVGPLGRAFKLEEDADAHVTVGGGTGTAPVYFLAGRAAAAGKEACLTLGFRDCSYRLPEELMSRTGSSWRLASDAGEEGCHRGTAVDLLRSLLDGEFSGRKVAVYTAGPAIMMKLVAELAAERGLPCQASLEARMACGLSVCRGCVVRAFDSGGGTVNRTVCTYGPVFRAAEVDWDSYLGMD
ncbi:MAG: dihydroorotate dehydrogenase electron transfer subunit [Planctomycetota bacterium]|jgi:dihydroorotate dehydrogenase electron transfer subunit